MTAPNDSAQVSFPCDDEDLAAGPAALSPTEVPGGLEVQEEPGEVRVRHLGLVVHTACGRIRGPVVWATAQADDGEVLRQQCPCEPDRQRWPGVDVSRAADLCALCARGLAGGTSRWAWLACRTCRTVLRASSDPRLALLPVGRHSIMNARYVRLADERGLEVQRAALLHGLSGQSTLLSWGRLEALALAAAYFPEVTEVPLRRWRATAPETEQASRDAAERFSAWLDPG